MDPLCANTRKKGVSGMTDVQNEKCYGDYRAASSG